jgi:hypothetical protein
MSKLDQLFQIVKHYNFFDQGHGYYYGPLTKQIDVYVLLQDIYFTLDLGKGQVPTEEQASLIVLKKFSIKKILGHFEKYFTVCQCTKEQVCYMCCGDPEWSFVEQYQQNYMPKTGGLLESALQETNGRLPYEYYTSDPHFKMVGAPYVFKVKSDVALYA